MQAADLSPAAFEEIEEGSALDMRVCAAYKIADPHQKHICEARGRGGRYYCLREPGHAGPHVAHLSEHSAAAWWPNAESREGADA